MSSGKDNPSPRIFEGLRTMNRLKLCKKGLEVMCDNEYLRGCRIALIIEAARPLKRW